MSEIALKIEAVSKLYKLGVKRSNSLKELFSGLSTNFFNQKENNKSDFWALKDISIEIKKGDAVGIIGKNGAGKSTLLKILSRITEPTTGTITVNGRIASLLEVGTGFHPELTGRENIYLNGAILGMTRREIKSKFDEIVDFSGVESFLETPVKRYSSGMYVRLAFAVAAHLESEILIIDEVLAVGDAEFQKKCLGKMKNISNDGRTLIFVSHNLAAVKNLCNTGIYLKNGTLTKEGEISDICQLYLEATKDISENALENRSDRKGNNSGTIAEIKIFNKDLQKETKNVLCGEDFYIKIKYSALNYPKNKISNLYIGISITTYSEQFVTALNNKMAGDSFKSQPLEGFIICKVPKLPLMHGSFYINISLFIDDELADSIHNALSFNVLNTDFYNSGTNNCQNRQGIYIEQYWMDAYSSSNI
jgi:lipopolysaccharide transport system ATP-binding protein